MRRITGFAALVLSIGVLLRADSDPLKGVTEGERALGKDIGALEEKMLRVADKLKERNPYYAEKLQKAFQKVKNDLLKEDVEDLIKFLDSNQVGNAQDKAAEIDRDIAALIAFLEDRRDADEMKQRYQEIKNAREAVKQLSKEHQENLDAMRKFNDERDAAVAEFKKGLDELKEAQRQLADSTQKDGPEELGKRIDQALAALKDLMKDQQGLSRSTEGAQSQEVKDLGQFLKDLNDLIGREEHALSATADERKMDEGSREALEQLGKLLDQQKDLAAKTSEAALIHSSRRMEVLSGQQGELMKQAEAIAEKLADMPDRQAGSEAATEAAKEMAEAARQMEEAESDLANETANLARGEQDKAIEAMERAKAALAKAADQTKAAKAADFERMAKEQQATAERAAQVAKAMSSQAENHPNLSMKDALEKGGAQTQRAAQGMQEAQQALAKQDASPAEEKQKEALRALHEAKAELERLSNQLAQQDKPQFEKLAGDQRALQDRASDLGNQMQDMAAKNVPSDGKTDDEKASQAQARKALQNAGRQMNDAASQMGESQQSLSEASPSPAGSQQSQTMESMKKAEEELEKLKGKLAKEDQEKRLKDLQAKQEELEKKAKALAEAMQEAAKKFQQDPKSSQAMQNAGQQTMGAKGEMNKANQQMGQKNKPQARQNQENAMAQLQKAKEELDKIAKQELTEQQKRELDRLARRELEMKKKAEQLAEQTQKIGEKKASESLSNAGKKMDQAGQQGQQGNSSQAQQEQEEAQKEIEEAERALEEAERQYASLMAEEKLAQMENILGKILADQKKIGEKTIELETARLKNGGTLTRPNRINVQKLGDEQAKVADESRDLEKKMEEEDSTVFSWVLKTAIDDMDLVKELLKRDTLTDQSTQGLERDIERKLQELLDALKKEAANRKKKRSAQGGGGGGGGRLVPPIAELKMLRQMQLNLKKKTEDFERALKKAEKPEFDDVQRTIVKRLAHEQGTLSDLTRKFAEALQGAEGERKKPKEGEK